MPNRRLIDIRNTIPKHPTRKWGKQSNITRIVVHTTASDNQDPNKTARYHITPSTATSKNHLSAKGAPGLAYHDFITKDGTVYHCNNYQDITWHCGIWNNRSVGVAMAFKGQDTGVAPTPEQYSSLIEHLVILCLYLKVLPSDIYGHREVPGILTILGNGSKKYRKTCPGMATNLDKMRLEVTLKLQERLAYEGLYVGPGALIDGKFGPISKRALNAFVPTQKGL